MKQNLDREKVIALAQRYCAGDLDDATAARLAAALHDSAEARRWFIEFMDLHSALAWECSSAADLMEAAKCRRKPAAAARANWRRAARFVVATPLRIALAVATCALVAFLMAMAATPAPLFRPWRWGQDLAQPVIAARVSAKADPQWQSADAAIDVGTRLVAGERLQLVAGMVEVTFEQGAVVTVVGPATLVIDSPARGSLREGKLSAKVSQRARGFTIETPGATIIDLGTEFGVSVPPRDEQSGQPLGKEEIHVFAGLVEIDFANESLPPRRLAASTALRFASIAAEQTKDDGLVSLAATQRARFPRTIERTGGLTAAKPLSAERHPPVTRGLVLWLAADGAIRCTSSGSVVAWEDMQAGDNRQLQHAQQRFAQSRPVWIAEAFYGQPALRFDGNDYLALPGADELGISGQPYEIYVVARSSSPEIQFLIGGGTEEFELHLNGEAGARFIPTGYFQGAGAADLGGPNEFSDGRPHLFAMRVLPEPSFGGQVEVDGRISDDTTVDDARRYSEMALRLGMRDRGQYGLQGEIAEVLIYRQSLTGDEQRQIRAYLLSKYSIR